jgi:trigger factor
MQVSVENTGGLQRRVTVQVPAERFDTQVQERLRSLMRSVRIAGFRPGKVPLRVVEQKYGRQVRQEVANELIRITLQDALVQENLRPVREPLIEPLAQAPDQPLQYSATFEIYPEVVLNGDYDFSVERPVVAVTEEDVDRMLEKLRRQRMTWKVVERPASRGDRIIVDFEGTVGGSEFAGNKAHQTPIELGSNAMVPGFEEQLTGVTAGEERRIEVRFPEDYPAKDLAGRTANFRVSVHSVSEAVLPALDDDFARAFGIPDDGVERLREEVRGNMEREMRQAINSRVKDQVFECLLQRNPVDLPKAMIDEEIDRLAARGREQTAGAPMNPVERSRFEKEAQRRVALGVIIGEIVRQNRLALDRDRVRAAVETIASSYENPEEVVKWYYSNQEMLAGVQSYVMEDQVVDWVLARVDVQENISNFYELMPTD